MYIDSIRIRNVRCFEDVKVDLVHPESAASTAPGALSNVTLLFGENGTGKTTALRSIALALLGPTLQSNSGFVPYSLVRRVNNRAEKTAKVEASVRWHKEDGMSGRSKVLTSLRPFDAEDRFDKLEARNPALARAQARKEGCVMLAYGAARRIEPSNPELRESRSTKTRLPRYDRIASLFDESKLLVPLDRWLGEYQRANPGRSKQTRTLINRLLEEVHAELGAIEQERVFIRRDDDETPMDAMSDGFRAFLGWVGDILYHVNHNVMSGGMLHEMRGIVLVDEVDLHLHPLWQRTVVTTLARALPKIQFVVTSHSPLVAGSMSSVNIRRIVPAPAGGSLQIEPLKEELFGRSVEQVLSSDLFALETTRAAGVVQALEKLSDRAEAGDTEAAVTFMQVLADGASAAPTLVREAIAQTEAQAESSRVALADVSPSKPTKKARSAGKARPKAKAKARKAGASKARGPKAKGAKR